MKLPQEIIYWNIIPGIRNRIVKELKSLGLSNEEIAKKLELSPSSVSLYLKDKRGKKIKFNKIFLKKIHNSSLKILNDESNVFQEIIFLLNFFKKEKMLCKICLKENNMKKCEINYY